MPWLTFSVWATTLHTRVNLDHQLDHFVHQPELSEGAVTARR